MENLVFIMGLILSLRWWGILRTTIWLLFWILLKDFRHEIASSICLYFFGMVWLRWTKPYLEIPSKITIQATIVLVLIVLAGTKVFYGPKWIVLLIPFVVIQISRILHYPIPKFYRIGLFELIVQRLLASAYFILLIK